MLVVAAVAVIAGSTARADSTIPVTPLNLSTQGFEVVSDDGTVPVVGGNSTNQRGLVTGPATPPLGSGSYEMKTATLSGTAPRSREGLYLQSAAGKTIGHLTDLGYSSYEPASNPQTNGPVIAIGVTDPSINAVGHVGEHYTALVYDPAINGFSNPSPIAKGVWQTWSPFNTDSRWYCTRTFTIGTLQCNAGQKSNSTVTWAQIQANIPTATINGDGIQLASGSTGTSNGYDGFETFIDAFIVGFDGNSTTYNFESPAPDTVYVDGSYTSSSAGGHVFGYNAFATIQAGVNAVASCGGANIAAGTYNQNVAVSNCLTLTGVQTGVDARTRSGGESVVSSMSIGANDAVVDGFSFNQAGTQVTASGAATLSGVVLRNNIFSGYDSVGIVTDSAGNLVLKQNLFVSPSADAEPMQIKANFHAGGCNGTQVLDNKFVAATTNGSADINFSCSGSNSSNITVSGNNSNNAGDPNGASLVALSGVVDGVSITNNTATTTGSQVFFFGSMSGTTNISNNSFTGGQSSAVALFGGEFSSDTPNSGTFNITDNNLSGNARGIRVTANGLTSAGRVVAHGNNLAGNTTAGVANLSPGTVDATRNWWGSANGPTVASNPGGTGAAIVGSNVTYAPWCTDPSCTTFSDNADLTALSLSPGTLNPAFSGSTVKYSVSVDNGVSSIDVTSTANQGATGIGHVTKSLAVGDNTVKVTVKSADGSVTKVYTITVNRAAASSGGGTPPPTTTTTPAPTQTKSADGTVTTTTPPNQAGTASTAAPTSSGQKENISVSWSGDSFAGAGGSTTPVVVVVKPATVQTASSGFSGGNVAVQITVTVNNQLVTQLNAPLVIHFANAGTTIPAYSRDNVTWTNIPRLSSPALPAGQQDGYFVNTDGSYDVYTRHLTYFGLLKDAQAPTVKSVKAVRKGGKVYVTIRATDNVRVAYYLVSINGGQAFKTTHPNVTRPVHKGPVTVKVTVVDTTGNTKSAAAKAR